MTSHFRLAGGLMAVAIFSGAQAQGLDALKNDAATPGDVLTYGMGYNNQRYSPLKQINKIGRAHV